MTPDTLPPPDGEVYAPQCGGLLPIGEGYHATTVRRLIAEARAQERERAEKAEAERDALREDAERYRFVRTADRVPISRETARDPVAYDAAIDAARSKT